VLGPTELRFVCDSAKLGPFTGMLLEIRLKLKGAMIIVLLAVTESRRIKSRGLLADAFASRSSRSSHGAVKHEMHQESEVLDASSEAPLGVDRLLGDHVLPKQLVAMAERRKDEWLEGADLDELARAGESPIAELVKALEVVGRAKNKQLSLLQMSQTSGHVRFIPLASRQAISSGAPTLTSMGSHPQPVLGGRGVARWPRPGQPLPMRVRALQPLVRPRACTPLCAATNLDHFTQLHAVGLQGLIQATRDLTQSAFASAVPALLSLALGALISGASAAWQAGGRYRESSGKASLTERDFALLLLCLCVDSVGGSSFYIGEESDALWAPISALAVREMFGSNSLALLNFGKEILPFSDVLPVATLAWLVKFAFPDSSLARAFELDGRSEGTRDSSKWYDPDVGD